MSEPQTAATVMIARPSNAGFELFMVRRSSRSAFMPDVFVFPGGRVEAQDSTPAARDQLAGVSGQPVDAAYVYAAARETFEECGILFATDWVDPAVLAVRRSMLSETYTFSRMLADLQTRIDAAALRYFSRWITPALEPRRFDTHFFVAQAPAGQTAQADAVETHDGLWIAPRDALARSAAGTLALMFPTIKHLERVSAFRAIDALLEFAANKPIAPVMPYAAAEREFIIPPQLEGRW
jgi:8-oxo-dGTP pyrophosphatase MutT (NUDIX family)